MSDLDEKLTPPDAPTPGVRARRQLKTLISERGAKFLGRDKVEITIMGTTTVWVREAPGGGLDAWFVQAP
jgi:hypothetical protein